MISNKLIIILISLLVVLSVATGVLFYFYQTRSTSGGAALSPDTETVTQDVDESLPSTENLTPHPPAPPSCDKGTEVVCDPSTGFSYGDPCIAESGGVTNYTEGACEPSESNTTPVNTTPVSE